MANWFTNVRKRVWQPIKKQGANLCKYNSNPNPPVATSQLMKKVREKLMSESSKGFSGYGKSSNASLGPPREQMMPVSSIVNRHGYPRNGPVDRPCEPSLPVKHEVPVDNCPTFSKDLTNQLRIKLGQVFQRATQGDD